MKLFGRWELAKHRRALNVVLVTIVVFLLFIIANPRVFLNFNIYNAVMTSVPIIIFLALSMVFVVTSGEMDLSFGSVMGFAGLAFAWVTTKTGNPSLGLLACFASAAVWGVINGLLVTRLKLSSLVSTLGMMFFLRGLIMVLTQGNSTPLTQLKDTVFYTLFAGRIRGFPVQMVWAIGLLLLLTFLYNRSRFGVHVHFVGDNRESAREMGVKVDRTIILTFVLVALAAALSAIVSALINENFWASTGDGYMLVVLAAVFLGGTPTWGGVGTIFGGFLGAIVIGFLETGIIAAGLTGFWTKLVYGLIIIFSIISHRYGSERRRV
jgi:ribose/xylose/arabinose/galactoside ABC-type transport system permease subunit